MSYFERNIQFARGGDLRKEACGLGLPPLEAASSSFPIALQLNPGQHLELHTWGGGVLIFTLHSLFLSKVRINIYQ